MVVSLDNPDVFMSACSMFQMFDVSIMMGVLRCSRAFWGIHFKDNNIDVQMLPIDGYKKLETEKVGCFS